MLTRRRNLLLVSVLALGCKSGPSAAPAPTPAPTPAPEATPPPLEPAAASLAPAKPPVKVTTVEGITEYRLDNGLRVLLFPDDSNEKFTINVTYFVGSRHEGYGETGMAHLLEHMVFKGTPKYPDIWGALEREGAQFNGTTWFDRTNYFETLPADEKKLEFAIAMEADRMVNSTIAADALAKEFSVVRNEFEAGENYAPGVLEERMMSTAFLWHNYGKSTIGSRADIERVPIENLRAFYKKYYQPDNAMVVLSGNFDDEKALALIQKHFGSIPRPTRKLSPTYTVEPVQDGERVVTLRRAGDVAVVGVTYHTVAGPDAEYVATDAITHLLENEPSGRLYKALVETGLASRVWGSNYPFAEPGVLSMFAEVKLGKNEAETLKKLEQVKQKMLEVVEGVGKSPVQDKEVSRFRTKALKDFKLSFTRSDVVAVELSEWAAQGDWRLMFVYRDRVEKLTPDAVKAVAAKYLKPANRTVGMFIPTKDPDRAPMPSDPDVNALVDGYKGRDAVAEGEQFEATVANIEKRTTRSQLASGMKIAMLAKETRGDAVRVVMTIRYGSEKELEKRVTAAQLLPEMVMRGTTKRTHQEIRDELDRLQAQVSIGAGDRGEVMVSVTTVRDTLPAVIDLVAEMLQKPSFPADELEILRKEKIAALEQQLQDPNMQGFIATMRKLNPRKPTDVRYIPTTAESIERIKAVKLDELKKVHKELWGAGHATLAVVGDFDPKALSTVLDDAFGKWTSPKPYKRIASDFQKHAASEEWIDTPDKEMALIVSGQNVEIRDDDPDYPLLEMANYLLGGSLQGRLFTRLRQKEGLSYGAFSFLSADSQDRRALFVAGAILAPQNAGKGMGMMMEELEKIARDGIPAEEMETAKKSWRGEFENRLTSDGYVAQKLELGLHLGRTMEFEQKLADRIASMKADEVLGAIKKYFNAGATVKITAGDKKKAAAQ